ncbi:hypothetical protein Vafri_1588 [Volvox africanus]|nr:hypothetical protein Vafri_1588 [Volvox africanus]
MKASACQRLQHTRVLDHAFRPQCVLRSHTASTRPLVMSSRDNCIIPKCDSPIMQGSMLAGAALVVLACDNLLAPGAAQALELHAEPGNALSMPTWAIHVSSVLEWVTAMGLMWKYAEASGNPRWKGMAWGMVPSLGSAMAACTWHFFYNSPDLEFLVVVQSALTVIGNCTCWLAAYRIYEGAMAEKSSA